MGDRITDTLLAAIKDMPAAPTLGQMHATLIHALRRDQLTRLALMTGLAAGLAHRTLIRIARRTPALSPRLRRIRRRRLRAVARITTHPPLKLLDAVTQSRNLRDLLQQPNHKLPRRLAAPQRDHLELLPPHTCTIPCITQEPCSTHDTP